jgi:hypothetical protein
MTEPDLTAIEQRLDEWRRKKAEAPPGEWKAEAPLVFAPDEGLIAQETTIDPEDWGTVAGFIAYAHNTAIEDDVAALLAEVRRLRVERENV